MSDLSGVPPMIFRQFPVFISFDLQQAGRRPHSSGKIGEKESVPGGFVSLFS
jgi:hypothetical protein